MPLRFIRTTPRYDLVTRNCIHRRQHNLRSRTFTVLALESSADDTCAAVVTSDRKILSNVVIKQTKEHESFGGIHPYVAVRAHHDNMAEAISRTLKEANIPGNALDGIAFTRGPGMLGCLSIASTAARAISIALNRPLVGVHHMQAHALTPFITSPVDELPQFPFLTLLVSGGHTLLLLATSNTNFKIFATTHDSSIGQIFDRVSRMLSLPWSTHGPGASLEQFCKSQPEGEVDMAAIAPTFKPALRGKLEFSYGGLHQQVERYLRTRAGSGHPDGYDHNTKLAVARAFQATAVSQLEEKVTLGLERCRMQGLNIRHVVVSGGVASNAFLRQRLRVCLDEFDPDNPISLVFPPPSLCTDNAVMIAWASMHRFLAGDYDDYNIEVRPKWSIEDLAKTLQ